MNVADPHITTKWNMVGEGRRGEERKQAFSSMHRVCAFITYTIPPFFILFCQQLSILFSYDPIHEEPAFPSLLYF
jgi:hypothetical protein